ncbi:MAG: AAA family ATPase [Oscillospiraceae bacterium]|nr:AAA family ATPase [Oscillospiraceae bacterium]
MMFLTIENFGPIKKFEYDLSKDLIVTYGGNNIGKSYAMQIAYLLLKNLYLYATQPTISIFHLDISLEKLPLYQKIQAFVQGFSEGTEQSISITKLVEDVAKKDLYDTFVLSFIASCENTFGNFSQIRKRSPKIELKMNDKTDDKIILSLSLHSLSVDAFISLHIGTPIFLKRKANNTPDSKPVETDIDRRTVYYAGDIADTSKNISAYAHFFKLLYAATIYSMLGPIYFLPASRSGLYLSLSAFGSMYTQMSMQRGVLGKNLPLAAIPEPIADYFLSLSSVRKAENQDFSEIYGKIERDILKGTVRFDENKLVYQADGLEYPLEMMEASSMVAEVSPIVAFLKYVLRNAAPPSDSDEKTPPPRPIIFIEEPEAHLHPENQIKLAELFAHLHESGVRLVMSSHSNYLFNKFNNLLLGGELTPDVYSAIVLKEDEDGKSVSAFMETNELGVDDMNFMDAAESLYNEREELIDKLNERG